MLNPSNTSLHEVSVPFHILRRRDIGPGEKLVYGFLVKRPAATCRETAAALGVPTEALFRSLAALRTAGVVVPNA
jgi:hypothetical protein